MAETSGPFDGTALAEGDWELMLQHLIHGVVGVPGDSALQASASGAVARGVDLAVGNALVRGHWYRNDALLTVSSDANNASSPRVDRAVLRLDRVNNTVNVAVIEGTPSSVPQPPAPRDDTSVTEVPIWRWTIQPDAGGVSDIRDERPWLGALVIPCTSTARPAHRAGRLGYETDTGRLILSDGSAWQVVWQLPAELTVTQDGVVWDGKYRLRRVGLHIMAVIDLRRQKQTWPGGSPQETLVATIPPAWRPPIDVGGAARLGSGNCDVRITKAGHVVLGSPDHDTPPNSHLVYTVTYPVA